MKTLLLFSAAILIATNFAFSQGTAINATGAASDSSAMLDVSSTSKGILVPRMSTAERNSITSPAQSLLIFNTTTTCFEYYFSGIWYSMSCTCVVPPAPVITAASNITSASFTANWNVSTGASGYYLDVSTDAGFVTFVPGYNNLGVGSVNSYNITGLTCNTTYYYRVRAANSCGVSPAYTQSQLTSACGYVCSGTGTFVDSRDGQTYGYKTIAGISWMCQNLNYGTYVTLATGQGAGGIQKYCYDDNTVNCVSYGGLYEWAEMMNGSSSCNGTGSSQPACSSPVQGICPSGWHIPSHYEWTYLEKNVGSNPGAFPYDVTTANWLGTDEGANLKSGGSSGFEALLAGYSGGGGFWGMNSYTTFWSSTESSGSEAWRRYLQTGTSLVNRNRIDKTYGMYVRCIKN